MLVCIHMYVFKHCCCCWICWFFNNFFLFEVLDSRWLVRLRLVFCLYARLAKLTYSTDTSIAFRFLYCYLQFTIYFWIDDSTLVGPFRRKSRWIQATEANWICPVSSNYRFLVHLSVCVIIVCFTAFDHNKKTTTHLFIFQERKKRNSVSFK